MFLRGVVFSRVLLSSSCLVSFILRDKVLSVVRERVKLVHYSTACSAFCRVESDLFVRIAQSDVLFAGHLYFSL